LSHTFTGAQLVVFDGASRDETFSLISIASHNVGVEHAFEGAVITTANTPALNIASGNKDMKRCFGGIKIGVGAGPWIVGGTTIPATQDGCPTGDSPSILTLAIGIRLLRVQQNKLPFRPRKVNDKRS